MIFSWLRKRRVASDQTRYDQGYNFAAGKLLMYGDRGKGYLESRMEHHHMVDPYDFYDIGVRDALAHYSEPRRRFEDLKFPIDLSS